MKRLLFCIAFALCAASLITAPANAADRGFALLDNVPIADTPQLVNSSADTAAKPAVINEIDSIDNGINLQMAMDVATLGAVGQQSVLSYTAPNMIGMTLTGSEAWGSSMASTKRVGFAIARYSVCGDARSETRLRPDPHLQQAQVATG